MIKLLFLFLIFFVFPTASFCFPYTQYKITNWGSDSPIIGYATIENTPIIYLNNVIQTNPLPPLTNGDIVFKFNIISLTILSGLGNNITDYSGYISLGEYNIFTNGMLTSHDINDYTYLTSIDGSTGLYNQQDIILDPGNLSNSSHNLLSSPLSSLPNLFVIRFLDSYSTYEIPGACFTYIPSPVPEPSTFLLIGAGLTGLTFIRRNKNKV